MRPIFFILTAVLSWPQHLLAVDGGHAKALQYMKFRGTGSGDTLWYALGGLAVIVVLLVLIKIGQWIGEQRDGTARGRVKKAPLSFRERAVELGFKMGEAKTLRNIAGRLAPHSSLELLTTDKGRASLIADLARRIRRREREIKLLQGVKEKLERIRDEGVHKRETVRVEADLPVWMVKKVQREANEEGEDVFTNIEQVPGHLIDLSEGGASVRSSALNAQVGDLVEYWSADTQIWFPPLLSGVLNVETQEGGDGKIYHFHFIDPPVSQLRSVIQLLKIEEYEVV